MNQTRRIALMLPKLSRYGGAEQFGWRLAEALARVPDYRVTFICARREGPPPEYVEVHRVGRYGLTKAGKMVWFALATDAVRKRARFDLTIGLGKTLRQDLLRLGGGPLEVFWRLSRRAWPCGMSRSFKMLRRRTAPANILGRYIERRQLENARDILAVSHKLRKWYQATYPEEVGDRIRIVYNRPDLTRFSPAKAQERKILRNQQDLPPNAALIGLAGTNFRLKGLEPCLHALAKLPSHCHLLVAGGRNPGRFAALCRELGLEQRVRFLGRVEDMPGFYRSLDCFVLPSFYDACANAVLEALACGIPCVSSASNGSSYFLPSEWVVDDPADTPGLAAAIGRALHAGTQPAFVWPEGVDTGLDPYLDLVAKRLDGAQTPGSRP